MERNVEIHELVGDDNIYIFEIPVIRLLKDTRRKLSCGKNIINEMQRSKKL